MVSPKTCGKVKRRMQELSTSSSRLSRWNKQKRDKNIIIQEHNENVDPKSYSEFCLPNNHLRFHVDKLSSAHVYLRLNRGGTMDTITDEMLEDCAQLVKANSIQGHLFAPHLLCHLLVCCAHIPTPAGNKLNNIEVVYTPWANLKKTGAMDVGQVGFHNSKLVSCSSAIRAFVVRCHSQILWFFIRLPLAWGCAGAVGEGGEAGE